MCVGVYHTSAHTHADARVCIPRDVHRAQETFCGSLVIKRDPVLTYGLTGQRKKNIRISIQYSHFNMTATPLLNYFLLVLLIY